MKALAACSPAPGRLDVFLGVDDGSVWHKVFDGVWSPWRPLGCPWPTPGAPDVDWLTATSSGPGRIELLALSGAHELWHRECAGDSWAPWTPRGTLARYSATGGFTAAAPGPGDLHVFYHAGDRGAEIVHRRLDGDEAALRPGPQARGRLEAVHVGPDRFDLFAANAREAGFLRGRYETGRPTAWDGLGRPPRDGHPRVDGRPSPGFAATERDFFAVVGRGLWHRALDGRSAWEDLGGDLVTGDGAGAAPLTVASWGAGRTDVFALWAGVAVMHRSSDRGTWSDWQLVDVWGEEAAADEYRVLRPEDLVMLTVRSVGLREQLRPDGVVELVGEGSGGRLIVDLPPQHIAESVLESGTSSRGVMADSSRLCFAVRQDSFVLSVDGVLDAMKRFPLVTAPGAAGQEVSRIELPWRMLSTLQEGTRCVHRTSPAPGTGGATELWHSRLTGPDGYGRLGIRPYRALPDASGLDTPLRGWVEKIVAAAVRNPNEPVAVDRLIMSPYGAWFSASVRWPDLAWSHRAAMGRDFHVEVATQGVLFPFGHRATYIRLSERRFEQGPPALAALRKREILLVTEPDRDYGIGAGGTHERAFPFQHVTIQPQQITELDTPSWIDGWGFWPTRGGSDVQFTALARAGQETVSLCLPLLFVGDATTGIPSAAVLDAEYARGPRTAARRDMGRPMVEVGRSIPLAMQSLTKPLEGAVQEVQSMSFGGVSVQSLPDRVKFYPKVTRLEVGLPAVRQLIGPTPPIPAAFTNAFLQTRPGEVPPDAMLDLLERRTLDFGAARERAGLLAAPSMSVNQIDRVLGPMVGGPVVDPRQLFGADATLFGVVPLRDIVSRITSKPKIVWAQVPGTPSATLTWKEDLRKDLAPFYPRPTSYIFLEAVSTLESGRPVLRTTGKMTNFSLEIPSRNAALVSLVFREVRFTANSGERPHLTFNLISAELKGKLGFLGTLATDILKSLNGGPRIETSATQVKATYSVSVPTIPLMVFTVQNLLLESGVTLSLTNKPITIDFALGKRERPFLVTVSGLGGGGYLELGVSAGGPGAGLQRFVGGIEFGAAVAMNFGIASGEVHAFGGVVCTKAGDGVEITGYLRVGGSVRVLGLIGVSIELTMSLTYSTDTNELSGSAKLVITVDLTFWSTSVTLECHKSFKGPQLAFAGDLALPAAANRAQASSVETALGPQGEQFPWQDYCRAFTGV
jgi:hypothetical protein